MRVPAISLLAALCAGCVHVPVDRGDGYGGDAAKGISVDKVPVRGFWVKVWTRERASGLRSISGDCNPYIDGPLSFLGELLASAEGRAVVATEKGICSLPFGDIDQVTVELEATARGPVFSLWTAFGSLSGFVAGIYSPVFLALWLGAGTPVSHRAVNDHSVDLTGADIKAYLYQYARFPQGLPEGWPPENLMRGGAVPPAPPAVAPPVAAD